MKTKLTKTKTHGLKRVQTICKPASHEKLEFYEIVKMFAA